MIFQASCFLENTTSRCHHLHPWSEWNRFFVWKETKVVVSIFLIFTLKMGEHESSVTSIFFKWVGSTTKQKPHLTKMRYLTFMKESTCLAYVPRFFPDVFFPQDVLNKKTAPSVRHFRGSCAKWMKCRIVYVWPRCLFVVNWCKIRERGWRRTTYPIFWFVLVPSQMPGIFTHGFSFGDHFEPGIWIIGCPWLPCHQENYAIEKSKFNTREVREQEKLRLFGVSQFRMCSP